MKTISTLVYLLVIISICAASAVLYLRQHYNISALLTITWIISLTMWIKANGLLEDKKAERAIQ
ncbi:MAG: hypothetical protein Q8918_14680 [Bacteroidota bacterium]|nr:hypothetical protein [Bacteroidota bacterium]MDP4251347.1 hypothetical protein [Bacteroidota bacterium]